MEYAEVTNMCMDYSKLWKLLAEKGLSKSDLMELTGLSSRVIGKLVKNETVTTDTLSKICAALSCDVGSIMECVDENTLSLYRYCRAYGNQIEENERVKKIGFVFSSRKYTVYFSKRAASKATNICCDVDGSVYWKQYHIAGGVTKPSVEKYVLVKPEKKADESVIVVIKGKPAMIEGLDEGIWLSAKRESPPRKACVVVMTESEFKLYEPK